MVRSQPSQQMTVMLEKLTQEYQGKFVLAKVNADDSMWTIDHPSADRASIVLTLEKTTHTWWKSVFKDAPERDHIDAQKVDSTKKMDEYDEKTQGAIRKIMFDQRQKQKGLPTSDDMKMNKLIDEARDLPGSPFNDPNSSYFGAPNPTLSQGSSPLGDLPMPPNS